MGSQPPTELVTSDQGDYWLTFSHHLSLWENVLHHLDIVSLYSLLIALDKETRKKMTQLIEKLRLTNIPTIQELNSYHWPFTFFSWLMDLKHLTIDCRTQSNRMPRGDYLNLSAQMIESFPRQLQTLIFTSSCEFFDSDLVHLPPTLKSLEFSLHTKLSDHGLILLPYSMQCLRLKANKVITNEGIRFLPPGLTELDLRSNSQLTSRCFAYLPTQLKKLDLRSMKDIDDKSDIDKLPSMLEYLNLSSLRFVTDTWISKLPRSLVDLNLSSATELTNYCIPWLPPSLTSLILSNNNRITNQAMPLMPQTLRTLDLHQNQLITNTCIPYLPTRLNSLHVGFKEMDREAISVVKELLAIEQKSRLLED